MAATPTRRLRVSVDGKFFRLGEAKFYLRGVTYGPFAPGPDGLKFATPDQTARDFALIRSLGANLTPPSSVPPPPTIHVTPPARLKLAE